MLIAKSLWWIEKLSSKYRGDINFLDESRSCREVIKTNSQKPRWIEIAITAIEKESSRGSIDSLAVEKCLAAVEIAQKIVFQEEKITNMNAIKHTT